jgi:membrane-associated phospholipid phosphatase
MHWWDVLASFTYASHFFAVWAIAGVLYIRNRTRWAAFAGRVLLLSYTGLLTYIVYPAAPPWYAAQRGLTTRIDRSSGRGFRAAGLDVAEPLIRHGQASVNSVAAIPSLHAGFAFLICFFFWRATPSRWRALLAAYPLVMGFSLVYTGEHYVIDVLLGALYTALAMAAVTAAERRFRRRRQTRGAGHEVRPSDVVVVGSKGS